MIYNAVKIKIHTHETVKHVTVKVRFLQECVQRKILLLVYIKTGKNISDIMPKQSPGPQFIQHRDDTLGTLDDIAVSVRSRSTQRLLLFGAASVSLSRLAGV